MAKKKVETFSTFEKRKNSPTNHIAKNLSDDTNKHDIIQANRCKWKDTCNKPFTIRIEQVFRCSLKTTSHIKIKCYLRRNSEEEKLCCYHLKSKKRRMIVGSIANKYKKCLYVRYQKELCSKVKLTSGKYWQDIVIKKREFC